ncbi:MAG: hypothetical protein HY741_13585, partial [Chloroflexi bacterium]|nr:hypothetical protein [Chloroflexota bacterium]
MVAQETKPSGEQSPALPSVWEAVRRGLATDSTADDHPSNIWQTLKSKVDIAQSRPARADGIVINALEDRTGRYHVLKNPRARTYLRLTPQEFWLWERLDGTRSVQDLVVAFFVEYHTFALSLVVGLVERLHAKHLLRESPQRVFEDVNRTLAERTIAYRLTWPARVLLTRPWAIGGLDKLITRLHRRGGWLFYTLPAQICYLIISLVGGYLFIRLLGDPRFTFGGEALGAGIALLWLAAILPIVIHELGHAVTTKHYGCDVPYGGLMLYFGMPAAFVDTSDIWMQGRRARLAVTWAGPYTGLVIGGFGAIVLWLFPDLTLAPFIFQMATVAMFTAVLNLNPLIKLDGYYLLSDALEIPQLRERSLAFVRHKCLPKLSKRERFSRDELIFVAFGVLSAVWTVYVILVSLVVWNARVASSAQTILAGIGDPIALFVNGLLILLALSFLTLVGLQLYQFGQTIVARARRARLLSDSRRAALTISLAALVLAFSPNLLAPELATGMNLVIGLAAFGWFVRSAFDIVGKLRGSPYTPGWLTCAAAGVALALAQIFRALAFAEAQDVARGLDVAGLALLGIALGVVWQLLAG